MQESQKSLLTSFLAKQRVETDRIMVILILFVSLGLVRRVLGTPCPVYRRRGRVRRSNQDNQHSTLNGFCINEIFLKIPSNYRNHSWVTSVPFKFIGLRSGLKFETISSDHAFNFYNWIFMARLRGEYVDSKTNTLNVLIQLKIKEM